MVELAFKAPGGLIRVTARLRAGHIDDLALSGNFTLLPASAITNLEQGVSGLDPHRETITVRLQEIYRSAGIQSPGVTPDDLAEAILLAMDSLVKQGQ